ncbi:MAG: metallophosphoesterase family protein [Deltaproteobacteria bacterium]|nr:metallophosphoesterase family protein [Deltaproteobacteria bacterium]
MRVAVFSDVHSNLEALTVVLDAIRREAPDRILFAGDAVGYGPDPNACVERIFEAADVVVMGNHDSGVLNESDLSSFNPLAQEAIRWTRSVLTAANREKLSVMPMTVREEDLFLVHAAPRTPPDWDYVVEETGAAEQFGFFDTPICLCGHTHRPMTFVWDGEKVTITQERLLTFHETFRYIVNVGSVGQSRDGNPDAAYVLYDHREKSLSFHRVLYNFRITQEKMRAVNMPSFFVNRLTHGR